jgi:hypothetical protein
LLLLLPPLLPLLPLLLPLSLLLFFPRLDGEEALLGLTGGDEDEGEVGADDDDGGGGFECD